ncbi:MAG TPA: hypothetical protein DEB10_03680 [Ruminococcaceae bacterium]|jgi:Trk-type K+ transport system membrane component|nr:hypothetical protein [Oscillospiraceae bacterium]
MGAIVAPPLIAFLLTIIFILGAISFVCGLLLLIFRTLFKKYHQPKIILVYSISFLLSGLLLFASSLVGGVKLVNVFVSAFTGG